MNENRTLVCTDYLHILLAVALITLASCGPEKKSERPSPPASDSTVVDGAMLKIDYSSPGVKERKIWDGLVPFFKIWRTGANEATVFSTSEDLLIKGDTLKAGKYAVFTIPTDKEWTVIFNKEWDQWGAYNYDPSRDELRISITPEKVSEHKERMHFFFEDSSLNFHWEYLVFSLEFKVL